MVDRQLPATNGFFFGKSEDTDEQVNEDVATLEAALTWLTTDDPDNYRDVIYQASW